MESGYHSRDLRRNPWIVFEGVKMQRDVMAQYWVKGQITDKPTRRDCSRWEILRMIYQELCLTTE